MTGVMWSKDHQQLMLVRTFNALRSQHLMLRWVWEGTVISPESKFGYHLETEMSMAWTHFKARKVRKKNRKRAIAKALHLEARTTSRQTFWVFRFFLF